MAMADFNDPNAEPLILIGVSYVKINLPDRITLLTANLFTNQWSWTFFKKNDAIDDALRIFFRHREKSLYGGSFKIDLISGLCV